MQGWTHWEMLGFAGVLQLSSNAIVGGGTLWLSRRRGIGSAERVPPKRLTTSHMGKDWQCVDYGQGLRLQRH